MTTRPKKRGGRGVSERESKDDLSKKALIKLAIYMVAEQKRELFPERESYDHLTILR